MLLGLDDLRLHLTHQLVATTVQQAVSVEDLPRLLAPDPDGVLPLWHLGVGERCRIVFIAPRGQTDLGRIATMGVFPGAEARLKQKRPSVVLEVGHTTLAVDVEIASSIYVRRLPREAVQ